MSDKCPPIRYLILLLILTIYIGVSSADTPNKDRQQEQNYTIVKLSPYLPQILGYEKPMTYLVMIQVSDELRPTGGFLKVLVLVELDQGNVTDLQVFETSQAEIPGFGAWDWAEEGAYILPPQPIMEYLGLGNWVIRDANWWLDFGDSAQQVLWFWKLAGFEAVDGVIAVNDIALVNILNALGGLTLSNGDILTGSSLKAYVISQFYQDDIPLDQQSVAEDLAQNFMQTATALSLSDIPAIFGVVDEEAEKHNVMAYFLDEELAKLFHDLDFDGALEVNTSDLIYLVESNLSYTKSSQMIAHTLQYNVELTTDNQILSHLTTTTSNNYRAEDEIEGFPSFYYVGGRWMQETGLYSSQGYYGGYTRFALPEHVQIISVDGFADGWEEPQKLTNLAVIGGYIGLEAGEQQQTRLMWTSEWLDTGEYSLTIRHQPGLPPTHSVVDLHYPECFNITSIEPEPDQYNGQNIQWDTIRTTDLLIIIQFDDGQC